MGKSDAGDGVIGQGEAPVQSPQSKVGPDAGPPAYTPGELV